MNRIEFKKDRSEVQRGVQLSDGRIIPVISLEGKYVMSYDTPFNLETGEIYNEPNENSTTLNEQAELHNATEVCCYDEYEINLGDDPNICKKTISKVIREFKENGFKVTERAILHNYYAWTGDFKSAYRDDENGYHLFSPCGCNPFQLRATTLHPSCTDWQETYIC